MAEGSGSVERPELVHDFRSDSEFQGSMRSHVEASLVSAATLEGSKVPRYRVLRVSVQPRAAGLSMLNKS